MKTPVALFVAGTVTLLYFTACGSEPGVSCETTLSCTGADGGGDAIADGGADVVQPPAGCDPAAEPKDAPKCVVSDFGVFVDAAGGSDGNPGTKESPVKTIGGALGKLGAKARVYVCEGTYAEHVKLTSAVSIYGGFACSAWSYSGNKAKVAPADAGYALQVTGVSAAATVADVSFTAIAGTDAAPSSIAALVTNTTGLTLRRVDLAAGTGFQGKTPGPGATIALMSSTPTAGTLNGNGGDATVGGLAQTCTCTGGGTSKGGGGGNVGSNGSPGETLPAIVSPIGANGDGQTAAQCAVSGSGTRGSDAPPVPGAAGAAALGALTENGWTPGAGTDGAPGTPGQGGGGGGGAAGGGGGGACGGCGGEGGKGGGGGGASIALATVASPVTLVASTLTAKDAGHGGSGGAGGDGAAGGTKGARGGAACDGGNGGTGGKGGGGGGGAGGISVGVLYKGPKPTLDSTQVTTGALGTKGVGAGQNGIDGQKVDTLAVQ